jgi:CxxC motif-containing protein (DUF1111 family)
VDHAAADVGKTLFTHEWTPNDPLSPGGDGLGPVFNAKSCVACHVQGGVGGGGGLEHNVTTFFVNNGGGQPRQGVIHAFATSPRYQENLSHANPTLPNLVRPTLAQVKEASQNAPAPFAVVEVSQRNTPALFGAKLIDDIPERVILAQERAQMLRWRVADATTGEGEFAPVGRAFRLPDGKIGKFGWKGQSASLLSFVQAACANELGLGNPGNEQPASLADPRRRAPGHDLTLDQCVQMTMFIAALPRPEQRLPEEPMARNCVQEGERVFQTIGCAECHVPSLGSVQGVYSDLLLHRMGVELVGGGSYNAPQPTPQSPGDSPLPDEWRTPPLWGVADSAPYLHDGRAATLEEAIRLHAGQATASARRYERLAPAEQSNLVAFLKSLRTP